MTCKVTFKGGPRDGETMVYQQDPLVIGCVDEAREQGMYGLYRTGGTRATRDRKAATARWEDLPDPDKRS